MKKIWKKIAESGEGGFEPMRTSVHWNSSPSTSRLGHSQFYNVGLNEEKKGKNKWLAISAFWPVTPGRVPGKILFLYRNTCR